jgi:hypothetical protein
LFAGFGAQFSPHSGKIESVFPHRAIIGQTIGVLVIVDTIMYVVATPVVKLMRSMTIMGVRTRGFPAIPELVDVFFLAHTVH